MILAAKHVCHAHVRVIYCIAEKECGGAIRAPDHEVSDVV